MVGVAAEVQDLHCDLAALRMHGLRDDAVVLGLALVGQHRAARHRPTALVGRDAAGDDQPGLAARTLGVKGGHALEAVLHFFQADVHRAHQYPVLQGGDAQVQRAGEMGEVAHQALHATSCINSARLCNQLPRRYSRGKP